MTSSSVALVAIGLFVASGVVSTYCLVVREELADRIIALDLALISLMGAIAIDGARRHSTEYFILLVVIAIIGFTATVAASQFIDSDGPHQPEADR